MGRAAKDEPTATLLLGTLDMLILRVLKRDPLHGWGIADRIKQHSQQALSIGEGSLYPALYRLEARGWVTAEWGTSENNRRAKYYRLTAAGRKRLDVEQASWDRIAAAIAGVLRHA
jgi:transcriptional regulator